MGQRSSSPQRENTISPANTAQTTPQLKASEQKKRILPNPCVVLITGCSSGVGLTLAVLLGKDAEKRFRVYATMRNMAKKGPLEEAAKDCLDDTLFIRALDVCSEESVNEVVQEVQEKESKIDVVVNNAGVGLVSIVECVPIEPAKKVFDINYFGVLRMLKAVLPKMKERQEGRIINISSVLGVVGKPFNDVYCSSKFAVEGLTESLAPVLNKFNISCCLVEPGPTRTEFVNNARALRENIDISGADEKTQEILKSALKVMYGYHSNVSQTADEVAEFIKDVILCETPHVRYQTNPRYGVDEVGAKLADPTGDKPVELITSHFFP